MYLFLFLSKRFYTRQFLKKPEKPQELLVMPSHGLGMELESERRIGIPLYRLDYAIRRSRGNPEAWRDYPWPSTMETVDHDLLFA